MSLSTCTIFSPLADLALLEPTLRKLAGEGQVRREGEQFVAQQRRLLRMQSLYFQPVPPGPQMDDMRSSLRHVFAAVPTEHGALRAALLQRIAQFQVAVIVTGKRLVGMEDLIFGAAKALDGMVFWGGNELLDAKGKLVMSFAGKTRVDALDGAKAGSPLPSTPLSLEALTRQVRSETALKAMKVPVNPVGQPLADDERPCRSATEVADRALALLLMGLKGNRVAPAQLQRLVERLDLLPVLSPAERAFIETPEPDEAALLAALWQFESAWAALWAVGWVEALDFPDQQCAPEQQLKRIRQAESRAALHAEMILRPEDELLEDADLSMRMHWALVDSHLQRKEPPADMLPGVVFERQRFFYWLIHAGDWDFLAGAI